MHGLERLEASASKIFDASSIDDLPDAIVRFDEEGLVTGLGGSWDELCDSLRVGADLLSIASARVREAVARAMGTGRRVRFRHTSSPQMEWSCVVEPKGDGFGLVASPLPPAEAGPTAETLRWLGRFADHAPFHFGITDPQDRGRFIAWNAHSERLFGYSAAEAIGTLTARDLHARENEFLGVLAAIDDGMFDGECLFKRRDGSTFPGRLIVVPIRDESGRITDRCGFIEDLTERNRAADALDEAHRLAHHDDRVRLMGQLAGGIAHDFNNLLTAIVSSTEMLTVRCAQLPGAREDLDVIRSAARSASSLTRRLLTFTRRTVEDSRVLDVPAWFRELLPFLARLVPERIRFEHELEGSGTVEIDPNELEQVLLNLVVNAVGAMPDGGVLTLRCSCQEERALFEVEDTGVGMPAELQEKVFDAFFTTRAEGTGLGLATAQAIVHRAGGEIWLLSARGNGSCFSVSVPLCGGVAVVPGATVESPPATVYRGQILLVEDQPDVRVALERLLRAMGFQVRSAPDVRSATLVLEELERLTLLLTDYMLPDGTGLDLLDDTRAIFPQAHTVMMSGYIQEVDTAGRRFDRLIAKPFNRSQLSRLLDELLGSTSASPSPGESALNPG